MYIIFLLNILIIEFFLLFFFLHLLYFHNKYQIFNFLLTLVTSYLLINQKMTKLKELKLSSSNS